jgi:hypothetical protein
LRLWQENRDGSLVWRASLQSAKTGERTGFLTLDALYAFLERQGEAAAQTEVADGDICDLKRGARRAEAA